jgi:large subunit ribosomal protein L6
MSRIGKKEIVVPANTEVKMENGYFSVKGPLGSLEKQFRNNIEIKIENNTVKLTPKRNDILTKALWGTYASHILNMIEGVNKPFEKKLSVEGVGYKSEVSGNTLILSVGFSHQVKLEIPEGVKVTAEKNQITVTGIDKEAVGAFAAKTRSVKKPEPYKGKGIRYVGEVVKMKQGKKTA